MSWRWLARNREPGACDVLLDQREEARRHADRVRMAELMTKAGLDPTWAPEDEISFDDDPTVKMTLDQLLAQSRQDNVSIATTTHKGERP